MNLSEHYIEKIQSEEKVKNPYYPNKECYKVQMIVSCYGNRKKVSRLFLIDEWEQIKEQGYYMDRI